MLREVSTNNDGTVDVLLYLRAGTSDAAERLVDPTRGRDATALARWAQSETRTEAEDSQLLRDYVELFVLDYLSANVARRGVRIQGSSLVADDNSEAFPPIMNRPSLDSLLRRIRTFKRFPRGLREALSGLDRAKTAALLGADAEGRSLLSPRNLVDLDERRAALLSLVEARIQEASASTVLVL